jgi:hypothetical protein
VNLIILFNYYLAFDKEPRHPPSKAQWLAVHNVASQHYGESILMLLNNIGFVLLLLTYG